MEFRLSFTFFEGGKKGVSFIPKLKCSIFFSYLLIPTRCELVFLNSLKFWEKSFLLDLFASRVAILTKGSEENSSAGRTSTVFVLCTLILRFWSSKVLEQWLDSVFSVCPALPLTPSFLHLLQESCLWWEERFVDQTASGHEEGTSRILLQVGSLCLWCAVWDPWDVALVSSSLEQLRMLENKLWKCLGLLCCGGSASEKKSQPVIFYRINSSDSSFRLEWNRSGNWI